MKQVFFILIFAASLAQAQTGAPKADPLLQYKPRPKGEIVSEAVAQAGAHVVTSREVILSHIIEEAMSVPLKKSGTPDRKAWLIDAKGEAFTKGLAQILLEVVVQLEAENFSIGQVSQNDVLAAEKHVSEQVKGWGAWQDLEISSAEVQQTILRKMRAKNFLKFKMDSSGVQISDDEAKNYYEKNRVKFAGMAFAEYKDNIKEALAQNQLQEKLKDWFDILKRKYRVRFLGASNS